MGLASKSISELRLGRDKSPAYLNVETFDLGDVGVGRHQRFQPDRQRQEAQAVGTAEGNRAQAFQQQHRLSDAQPRRFLRPAGLLVWRIRRQHRQRPQGQRRGTARRLWRRPLNVALGYGQSRGGTDAVGVDYKSTNIGASYNFGMVKPMVLFATGVATSAWTCLPWAPRCRWARVNCARRTPCSRTRRHPTPNSKKLALGYGYNLSKRTQLYATVARMTNDDGAKRGLAVSSSSPWSAPRSPTVRT